MTTRAEALSKLIAPGAPYEIAEVPGLRGTERVFVHAPDSLRDLFEEAVSDAPFLVYGDERLTFAESYALACVVADVLVTSYGVKPGDRVAISMRNYPEWIIAFMATTSIGAIAVAMNALWQTDELAYGLTDSGAKVLFADQERLDRLSRLDPPVDGLAVIAVRPQRALMDHTVDLASLVEAAEPCAMPDVEVLPSDPATIFYTSGSTGHPKGVLSTHRNVLHALLSWELEAHALSEVADAEPDPEAPPSAALLGVPLFHVTGSHAVFLSCYRAQRKLVCMHKWDPEVGADLIEREQVTTFIAAPAMTGDLVRHATSTGRQLASLQVVGGGGAPRAPEQVAGIDQSFAAAAPNTGWGMTETNAIGVGIYGDDYLEHPLSSGRCSAVLDLMIVDDEGSEVPQGERGELLVRGTSVFREYWNRPDATAEAFTDDWFHTGDVATIDEDGFVYIVDRIKDLIIRGGENIGCGHVEAALLLHPLVHEAAVYAVPDERLGEEVGATIYADATLERDELGEFLALHLAAFEVPRHLEIRTKPLPRTATGKIFKRQLQP